jgi:hypothetical protein
LLWQVLAGNRLTAEGIFPTRWCSILAIHLKYICLQCVNIWLL